jgi:hypothetical protein
MLHDYGAALPKPVLSPGVYNLQYSTLIPYWPIPISDGHTIVRKHGRSEVPPIPASVGHIFEPEQYYLGIDNEKPLHAASPYQQAAVRYLAPKEYLQ